MSSAALQSRYRFLTEAGGHVFTLQGFAFINFHRREDAAKAIAGVSGFGYDHLILNVEWAK